MNDSLSPVKGLDDLLEHQALRRPDAAALTDGSVHLTWSEYRDRAALLAGAMHDAGARAGDRVAVHLPKSIDSFVAVHAILRLGAIVVPIDWFAPVAHARSVIADAEITAMISTASDTVLDDLLGTGADRPATVDPAATGPVVDRADVDPGDDAYIVYTSGSTGRPKGIVHTHASALAYATAAAHTYGLTPDDRLANVASLHFDQSTFELYAAPLAGAAVVVLSDVVLRFPASAAALVEQERVTVWYSVPYAIIQLTERGGVAERDLSSLRWVLFGGESFPPGSLASSMQALPTARFSNVYGPAEVNQCTFHHLDAPPTDDQAIPIGRAWPAADLLLIDEAGAVINDETPGHLIVRSETMMSRYWRRDDLTSAATMTIDAHPSSGAGDDVSPPRWYRTGDQVVRRSDGLLVFLGRFDHQVKVRGHRIELEGVEAAVVEHPAVTDCAVLVERGRHGDDDRIIAAVSPELDDSTAASILRHLRDRLPRYSLPGAIVGLPTIARTGNGKIDRPAVELALRTHLADPAEPADSR